MNFRKYRIASGLTQQQAANALGISYSTVSMWETNKSLPRGELLIRIAALYQCSVDNLLNKSPVDKSVERTKEG